MLKKSTAVLILENGEPSIVVVDYNTYKGLLGDEGDTDELRPVPPMRTGQDGRSDLPAGRQEMELLERINKDILALKEQIEDEEKGLGID